MMNYYGFPPGYDPNPHPSTSSGQALPAAPPAISPNILRRATNQGASHISPDGQRAYVKRFKQWYQAEWTGIDFGCWWNYPGEPEGAVRLE